jgi:pyruvate/2-oxoglutarate dehydrogenase complex dihydrolipoamide dehydrogenase (E3) component
MELVRSGVEIRWNQPVDGTLVAEMKPDAVIVATGSKAIRLDVPGSDNSNVFGALEVLNGTAVPGNRVVVIGGGLVGCETAEYLAAQGKRVTIVEMLDEIAADIPLTTRSAVIENVKEAGIRMEVSARAVEFTDEGVVVESEAGKRVVAADSAVVAVGLKPEQDLAEKLEGQVKEIHVVGDCAGVRRIRDAIHEGARAGREV